MQPDFLISAITCNRASVASEKVFEKMRKEEHTMQILGPKDRCYIYPALHLPHPGLSFDDQFAFRPSGSTTAAVIALLHTVRPRTVVIEPVCPRLLVRLHQSVRHGAASSSHDQNGTTEYSRQCL